VNHAREVARLSCPFQPVAVELRFSASSMTSPAAKAWQGLRGLLPTSRTGELGFQLRDPLVEEAVGVACAGISLRQGVGLAGPGWYVRITASPPAVAQRAIGH
jgi:hypothetical protein